MIIGRKISPFTVIKLVFKTLIVALVLSVISILLWRIYDSYAIPKNLTELCVTDEVAEAYKQNDGELTLVTQGQNSTTRTPSNYGYFTVSQAVFIPEANQLQLLVRYNDSTLKALKKDYSLDFDPDVSLDWYDVSVVVSTDLTPDNENDNLSAERESVLLSRIQPTEVAESEHVGRYSYRKLIFDGISLDEGTLAVYVDFYYNGDIAYNEADFDVYTDTAYGTLCVYTFKDRTASEPLSRAEKNAIEECLK